MTAGSWDVDKCIFTGDVEAVLSRAIAKGWCLLPQGSGSLSSLTFTYVSFPH